MYDIVVIFLLDYFQCQRTSNTTRTNWIIILFYLSDVYYSAIGKSIPTHLLPFNLSEMCIRQGLKVVDSQKQERITVSKHYHVVQTHDVHSMPKRRLYAFFFLKEQERLKHIPV